MSLLKTHELLPSIVLSIMYDCINYYYYFFFFEKSYVCGLFEDIR
jgi:hypothetical protein